MSKYSNIKDSSYLILNKLSSFFLKPSISCLTVERIDSSLNNSMRLGPTLNPFGLAMQDFGKIHSDRCCHWKSFAFIYILIHLYGMSLSLSTHCLYSYLCLYKAGRKLMQPHFSIAETLVPCHVFLNLQSLFRKRGDPFRLQTSRGT